MKNLIFVFVFLFGTIQANAQYDNYDLNLGNPDTALAIFLWKLDYSNPNFAENEEEFIRWDLEHGNILHTIVGLYKGKKNLYYNITQLEHLRKKFKNYEIEKLKNTANEYYSILDEIAFDYLRKKNDLALIPIINQVLNNKNANREEVKILMKIYNDIKVHTTDFDVFINGEEEENAITFKFKTKSTAVFCIKDKIIIDYDYDSKDYAVYSIYNLVKQKKENIIFSKSNQTVYYHTSNYSDITNKSYKMNYNIFLSSLEDHIQKKSSDKKKDVNENMKYLGYFSEEGSFRQDNNSYSLK